MLINARYLNLAALDNYVAEIEGGIRTESSDRRSSSNSGGASVGISSTKGDLSRTTESEQTITYSDHSSARLQRLIKAGRSRPDDLDWQEVVNPEADFSQSAIGTMIEWECDIYIPDDISILSNVSGARDTLESFGAVLGAAKKLELNTDDLPSTDEFNAVTGMLNNFNVPPAIIGEDSDTDWRIVATLEKRWLTESASLDDRVRIIGKIKKRIQPNRWHPLASLPGMNLLSREDRR